MTPGQPSREAAGRFSPPGRRASSDRRRGTALLVLVLSLILLGVGLAVGLPRATHDVKRAREVQLRFILGEYRRAAARFRERHGRWPTRLEELEADASGVRYLRRRYRDPMTGTLDWQVDLAGDQFCVRSTSSDLSLAGVPYREWR